MQNQSAEESFVEITGEISNIVELRPLTDTELDLGEIHFIDIEGNPFE